MVTCQWRIEVVTAELMQQLGSTLAQTLEGGDLITFSGPLGAGKTTFIQGIGSGLGIDEPIVSPTFTIARELRVNHPSQLASLVHVDAYRLFSRADLSCITGDMLLDELETIGLDEVLDEDQHHACVVIEWGEAVAHLLAQDRLEIRIDRSVYLEDQETQTVLTDQADQAAQADQADDASEHALASIDTSEGLRIVHMCAYGERWVQKLTRLKRLFNEDACLQ